MGTDRFSSILTQGGRQPRSLLWIFIAVIAFSGCATKDIKKPVFFPKPPNPPHVQYLTSFSIGPDVADESIIPFLSKNWDKNKVILKPYGVMVRDGKIYVTDTGLSRLTIIDLKEKEFSPVENQILGLWSPTNLTMDDMGNIYIADPARREIVVVDPKVNRGRGIGKELNMKPTDLAVSGERLYVLDYDNSELKILDRQTGKLLKAIGKSTDPEKGLSLPTNLMLDEKNGCAYVSNQGTGKVVKMDLDGNILKSVGGFGDTFGKFSRPKGVFVDDDGYIHVVDAGNQVVQIFNQEGRLLMFFGERGSGRGTLDLPADIFVTREKIDYFNKFVDPTFELEKLIFVTNQTGPRKVSVFAMGHSKEEAVKAEEPAKPQEPAPEAKKNP